MLKSNENVIEIHQFLNRFLTPQKSSLGQRLVLKPNQNMTKKVRRLHIEFRNLKLKFLTLQKSSLGQRFVLKRLRNVIEIHHLWNRF